jgi:hypothetical protein
MYNILLVDNDVVLEVNGNRKHYDGFRYGTSSNTLGSRGSAVGRDVCPVSWLRDEALP